MARNSGLVRLALLAGVIVIIVLVVYIWNQKSTAMENVNESDEGVNYVDLDKLMGDSENADVTTVVTEEEEGTEEETEDTKPDGNLKIIMVKEGDKVSFPNLQAADPDSDSVKWTFGTPLDSNGEWQTKQGDAGTYTVDITASDGELSTTEKIMIIVQSTNAAPVIDVVNTMEFNEGDTIILTPTITDNDKDALQITYSGFMDSNRKVLSYNDAGEHTVTITVSDGKDTTVKRIRINVKNVNRAPVITNIV